MKAIQHDPIQEMADEREDIYDTLLLAYDMICRRYSRDSIELRIVEKTVQRYRHLDTKK